MMYATKQPTLRIKQADLKCKNGCGFYGNAEWEGYCSKCYREHVQKDRERERKANREKPEHSRSRIPGFSKFEEKKRQQTDKKNKYLKNVFRKSSNTKDTGRSERQPDTVHVNPVVQKLTAEYIAQYGEWGENVRKDFLKCVHAVYTKVMFEIENKPIEDIAELVQKYYNMFLTRLNSIEVYQAVNPDVRDTMLDFFEKFTMISLYSILFCPTTTNDEEKDLAIQDRIRKLSWVTAHHLGCCISETSVEVRDLVYTAIADLLGVDAARAPQEKLACVVNCCRSVMKVLQHCQGGPVSADEFLPALIFIVLKGNPARLKSNIHYVTRFCNDSRLMQGEGGYYFTNLCCAVSFIENLTAESLNMTEEEFKAYMTGTITPVSAWESALVACESMHQLCENLSLLKNLSERTDSIQNGTGNLRDNILQFKEEISSKVKEVLERTPLLIKPRKSPIDLDRQESINEEALPAPITPIIVAKSLDELETANFTNEASFYGHNLQLHLMDKQKLQLNVTSCLDAPKAESLTPEGLSNVNYDIDFSDLSAENSVADELTPEKNKSLTPDPFSPVGSSCNIAQTPLKPSSAPFFDTVFPEQETILDKSEPAVDLPTPLQPTASNYSGFSKQGWQIPSIPCSTGDFSFKSQQGFEDDFTGFESRKETP